MRTSDRGNERRGSLGFTLVELIVVATIIAIGAAVASLALRDSDASRLDEEAERLVTLLESARAEARAAGLAGRWEPLAIEGGFRFSGLTGRDPLPSGWLYEGVAAEVVGARAVVLGPEPVIGAQRIVLRRGERQVRLETDGLAPFAIAVPGP